MIPKVIHFCWFGNQKMGRLEEDCLDSWRKIMPEFKLRLWNEDSLDLRHYPFAWEAFQAGKFAFVSDVIRLHALFHEGGIYLDTDVLILKNFNQLLNQDFFVGESQKGDLNAAVLGSVVSFPLLYDLLDFYQSQKFNFLRPLTIPEVFNELVWKYSLENGRIYSPEYFYPLPFERHDENFAMFVTENSYCVHLWNHSWKDEFMLLKDNRFMRSISLAIKHVIRYPETYRNFEYLNRYFVLLYRNLKRYGKLKILRNA